MTAIVCTDFQWGIAKDGKQPVFISEDLKRFRNITTRGSNSYVIMGGTTFRGLPGMVPLKDRTNVVLSHSSADVWCMKYPQLQNFVSAGRLVFVSSIAELACYISTHPINKALHDEWYVIGGGEVYRELIPLCDTAHVTRVYESFDADTFFPNLDESPDWEMLDVSQMITSDEDIVYRYEQYMKKGYCS